MLGAVSATDGNVSITEDSNLDDCINIESSENKLEISNEYSISETDSQTDNLGNCSYNAILSSNNNEDLKASNSGVDSSILNKEDDFKASENNMLSVTNASDKVPVDMDVTSAVANSSATLFKVSVKDSETGAAVAGYKVLLILDGKKYLGVTDGQGIAPISTKSLDAGTYDVTLRFAGTISRYAETEVTREVEVFRKVLVKMNVTSAIANSSATLFKVSVKDSQTDAAVAGYKVLLILDGKSYVGVTDGDGIAAISTKSLNTGNYTITLKFAGTISRYDATVVTLKVYVFKKIPVVMDVPSAVANSSATLFKVSVKDSQTSAAVAGYKVLLILDGKSYVGVTDSKGIATISTKPLTTGDYSVTLKFAGTISRYDATTTTKKVYVFKKIPVLMSADDAVYTDSATPFRVSVKDSANGNAVTNAKVVLVLEGKNYLGVTNDNGVAEITTKHLDEGTYNITMKFAGTASRYEATNTTQSVKVSKYTNVPLKDLIKASTNVKNYILNYEELPIAVTIGDKTYTAAQYLYLASEAIYKLKSKDTSAVPVKLVDTPKSYTPATNLGNLVDYYSVAKRVADYGDANGIMPNYAISDVGNIGYDGLIYAFARVIAYYGDNSQMPNYVTIKSISSRFAPDDVNTKNTIKDLTPYLKATKNCQVNNAQIQALAAKLTDGLTSPSAKAEAIYNYVRDSISYSFYYDTKYGAVGTLNSKTGNCVDQAHLVIALFRAANLPARYVHGTCTFSSGTYGHVWAQVLLGDIWTVADPTSNRNSLGSIANWNTKTYSLNGYYAEISF